MRARRLSRKRSTKKEQGVIVRCSGGAGGKSHPKQHGENHDSETPLASETAKQTPLFYNRFQETEGPVSDS